MKNIITSQSLILLAWKLSTADANPVGAVPGAKTTEPPGLKTLVTAVTDQGSTYTLTYVPSTITAATVLVEGTSTASVNAGAVIGALAGGAALAALPFAIPKAVPEPVLEGDGSDGGSENTQRRPGCETKTAKACTEDCTADWFVSSKKVQTTATCTTATCTQTTGCIVTDATKTNSHPVVTPTVTTLTTSSPQGPTTAPPLDYGGIQVYLGKEYLRLHIDNYGDNANADATCEKDVAKGVLEMKGVKDNIADFCKSNNGFAASPNKGLLKTYDQDENRMQVVLQVSYSGDRGQGATYTVDEKKCNDLFGKVLPCGPDKDHTSGGNITSEKGVFSLEPYTYPGKLECAPGGGKYGVVQGEALANIDDFCTKFDGQKINQGEKKDDKFFQKVGGLLSTISVAWEPSSIGCQQGGLHDHGYLINKAACKRFLGQTINDCNKDKADFKAAGVTTDQCAKYQISIESRETVVCGSDPRYSEADRARWHAFDPKDAHDAISEFCGKDLLADPAAVDKSGGFSQNGDWPTGIAKGGKSGISIEVSFHTNTDLGALCGADTPKNQAFKTGGDDCQRRLGKMVVDGCDTDKDGQKKGGWLVDSGINGCIQWQIGSLAVAGG